MTDEEPFDRLPRLRLTRSVALWLLVVMAMCILAMRVHLIDEPLDRDTTNYAVLAREVAAGRPLYTDLWLHSPPGIVWVYQLTRRIAGDGPIEMFALGLACAWGTLAATYLAAATMIQSRSAGLWAAGLWTIFSGSLPLEFNLPSCEVVMVLCVTLAMAVLLRTSIGRRRWMLFVAAGVLLAMDSMVKQVTLPITLALAVAHAAVPPATIGRRRALMEGAVLLAVTVVAWAALFLWLWHGGMLAAFWEQNVTFNFVYSRLSGSGGMLANLLAGFRAPTRVERPFFDLRWVLVLLIVSTGTVCTRWVRATAHAKALLVASAVGSYVAIALPGNFFEHYFQLAVPNICIETALVVTSIRPRLVGNLIAAAAAVALLWVNDRYYSAPAAQWPMLEFLDDKDNALRAMSTRVSQLLKSGETAFDWGDDPQVYFYTGCRPPTGFLFSATVLLNPKFQGPWSAKQHARSLADLQRSRPELLVVYNVADISAGDATVGAWLKANYRRRPETVGIVALYENVHGRLAAEEQASTTGVKP